MKFQINRPSTIENRQSNIPSNIAKSPNPPILKSSNRPIISPSPRLPVSRSPRLLVSLSLLLLLLSTSLFAQNEANVWYFHHLAGLDFNSGEPEVLTDGPVYFDGSCATISDSSGNYLFCCGGGFAYDRTRQTMQNGALDGTGIQRGYAIVKHPGEENIYYIFKSPPPYWHDFHGLFYSVVDMTMNVGKGAIMQKNIPVEAATDISSQIAIVKKNHSESVWVITRKNEEDAMAAFLVDESGFHPDPVLSPMPDGISFPYWQSNDGFIKISPDKKYLISSYSSGAEFCHFNSSDGTVEYMYKSEWPVNGIVRHIHGFEFSPDSKYLYVGYYYNSTEEIDSTLIIQYDMQYVSDSIMFKNSAIYIGAGITHDMQLARDGKIYLASNDYDQGPSYFDVIHKPWIEGPGCQYENNILGLFPGNSCYNLPNILVDYLFRFEWTSEQCQGYPIQFNPNFIPTPQTIQWNFDEGPGSTSWQLSPAYTFKNPGVHEVKVDVWYPSGRYEHTSREIEIYPSPQPDLGPDILICDGATIILYANCVADFFTWSSGQFGVSSITVSDSGTYWVKGKFSESGCEGYDTIYVGFHPPTIIDETTLIITPTTCNGTSGSITGLTALGTPPFAYRWRDLSEVEYGTDIDVSGLPAGQYYLTITDSNSCVTVSEVYTIEDAGDLQVTQVQTTRPHCFRDDGQIVVHAFSPSESVLEYSIDAGVNYQYDSVFSGLFASGYAVQVRDENGCSGFYLDNPVVLEDIPGPQVTAVNVTDETDFLGNGAIEIVATGSTPVIYYSMDGGTTYQSNNGTFNNLGSGIYDLLVWDENGCDTTFSVEIQNIILTYLHAVTGEDGLCEDSATLIPVTVDNFNSVADFRLKLGYNADNLQCEGFINVHPQLLDSLTGLVDQAAGDIHLTWKSTPSVTFTGTEKVADLVFTTKNPGQGQLSWYTGTTESYFTNAGGNLVPALFQAGAVEIYAPPAIFNSGLEETACLGQIVSLTRFADGNQPPFDYLWTYPDGHQDDSDPFFFGVTQADAGQYILVVTDYVGCSDQQVIQLIVSENPIAAFYGSDTLEMHAGEFLDAGYGFSSYLWNTGDTTASIVINAEGMYLVEMVSSVGCIGSDSVYVKLKEEELPPEPSNNIFIPNAFSPDGDGINDIFLIIFPNSTFSIQHSTLSIFDRWGGEVFSGEGVSSGWDGKKAGKECPGGVYVYKIVFSVDGVPGSRERVGTVMLVR